MMLNISIETSGPEGKSFRMALGITIPVALFAMMFSFFWA